jgi:formylglycine-generating enzyme required for sulfatase activity
MIVDSRFFIKVSILIFYLIFSLQISAQQHISVKDFKKDETSQDARIMHPRLDQNGEKAALIKVETTETGFTFQGGMLGMVGDTEQKVAEIWVYVPKGAQRITIMHPRLGALRDYAYPITIEAATVYIMELAIAPTTIIEPEAETQWLVVTSIPDGADVYIDNIHKGQTPVQMEMNTGTYSYRIEKPLYHLKAGRVALTIAERATINETLDPNFGYLKITTQPESGAEITINGNKLQQTTPHTTDRMPAGEYQITVSRSMFHSETRTVTIGEGKTEEVLLTLKPDYGLLRVVTNPEPGAEVMINGNRHSSKTPFTTERLRAGNYELSVSLPMYHPETREVTIGEGKTTEVVFDLRPSFGVVSVSTKPESGAEVLVNGISTGKTTPCDLERLPTGQHQITVRKEWYQPKTIAVKITDGLSDHFEIEMEPTYGILNVTAEHEAEIFIGDDSKATSKWEGRLIAGWYTVEARKDKYHSDQKRVEIKLAETQNLSLHPKPMTGAIKIQTTPFDAAITINGKDYGKTPATIKDLLIGNYSIILSKPGYAALTRELNIVENETLEINETLSEGINIEMVFVKGGNFTKDYNSNKHIESHESKKTYHTIEIKDFYFGKHEVTQKQWKTVMEQDPPRLLFKGCDNCPVESVSWYMVQDFIAKLNKITGRNYRLPYEVEWEYAANFEKSLDTNKITNFFIDDLAWYLENSNSQTHEVGSKRKNKIGLYDMIGNVWEWCNDNYLNNTDLLSNQYKIIRGGGWNNDAVNCRFTSRFLLHPSTRSGSVGFRLVLTAD